MKKRFAFRKDLKKIPSIVLVVVVVTGLCALASIIKTNADSSACQSSAAYGTDVLPSQTATGNGTSSTPYYAWVRMKTSSSSSNSVGLLVGSNCYSVGGTSLAPNTWTWVNYQNGSTGSVMQQNLNTGSSYNIELFGNQPGISVDQVELLTDPTCVPNGTSGNCIVSISGTTTGTSNPSTPTVSWVAPTNTTPPTTLSGATPLSVLGSDANIITNVTFSYSVTTSPAATGTIATTQSGTNGIYSVIWPTASVPNGTYNITATVIDSAGQTATTTPETVIVSNGPTCTTLPTAPSNLADTDTTPAANKVDLSWSPSSVGANCNLGGYFIYRTGGSGGAASFNYSGQGTYYTDTTVAAGTTYSYQVAAYNAGNSGNVGSKSTPLSVTTGQNCATGGAQLSTPTLSEVSSTYTTINLQWSKSSESSSGCQLVGYHIYRNGSLLSTPSIGATSTSYTDTGLMSGTSYTYTVVAYDNGGNSSATGGPLSIATETDNVAPTQPTGLQAKALSSTSVSLTWGPSSDLPNPGAVGLKGYYIYRNNTASPIATVGASVTSYSDNGLSPSTSYEYSISAFDNNLNTSVPVADVTVNTPASPAICTGAPSTPTQLTATGQTPTTISLSWNASTAASNCALEGYQVSRNNGTPQLVTGTTVFTDLNLNPNTSYSYTVSALDTNGHTSSGNPILAVKTLPDTVPPSAPSNVADSVIGPTQVQLTWTASTDNVGVTAYNIYRNGGTTPYKTVTNVTSFLDSNAVANSSYTYQVSAVDAAGNESAKTSAQPSPIITPKTTDTQAPSVPSGLRATIVSSSSIGLTWNASTDNVGVSGYDIYRNGILIGTTGLTNYTDNNLSARNTYSYTVKAYDAAGNLSVASSPLSVTTQTASSYTSTLLGWYMSYFAYNTSPAVRTADQANVTTTSPVTIEPATLQEQGVSQVAYYLNNKLQATVTTAPYAYRLNTTNMLNGQYTLTAKMLYSTGTSSTITQHLTLASAWSWTQTGLFFRHYLLTPIIIIIALLAIWVISRQVMGVSGRDVGGLASILAPSGDGQSETTVVRPSKKE
jgi:fibronectin type 3 domain-containing protein